MTDRAERFDMALGQKSSTVNIESPERIKPKNMSNDLERKLDNVRTEVSEIKTLLLHLTSNLDALSHKIADIDRKCDQLTEKFDGEVLHECKKMGSHIDFVENVYDNVKHPLTFICNKVKYLSTGETPIEPTYHITGPDDDEEVIDIDEDDDVDVD
jgi:hypothetical protein